MLLKVNSIYYYSYAGSSCFTNPIFRLTRRNDWYLMDCKDIVAYIKKQSLGLFNLLQPHLQCLHMSGDLERRQFQSATLFIKIYSECLFFYFFIRTKVFESMNNHLFCMVQNCKLSEYIIKDVTYQLKREFKEKVHFDQNLKFQPV